MSRTHHSRLAGATALVVVSTALVLAGDLNPPGGPVVPTHKTLTEIEPRTGLSASSISIGNPGSYYLLNDVGRISISASNVSLDLNGFTVSNPAGIGINVPFGVENLHIRNGFIVGCQGAGIGASLGVGIIVENVTASGNGDEGIQIGQGIVRRCVANGNVEGFDAIGGATVGRGSLFIDCVAYANSSDGFVAANGGIEIRSCSSYENGDDGFFLNGGRIENCVSRNNAGDGFQINLAAATSCFAYDNAGDGFDCTRSRVFDSFAITNDANGFYGDYDNTFDSCHSDENTGDEFLVDSIRNHLRNNNAAGSGTIVVTNVANVIIGNTAASYSIAAGNLAGPLVTSATIATNTNPSANYDY